MCKINLVVMCALLVGGASIGIAQQPVTVTATADFLRGNNEGLISAAQDRVTRDRITAGTAGAWSSSSALPSGRLRLAAVTHGDFAYAIGGLDESATVLSEVLVAPISANGSVGGWNATTALPSGRQWHYSIVYNGFLYVMGGSPDFTTIVSDVLFAPIHEDGTVGAWSTTSPLPSGRYGHTSVAYNGFIYVMGGYDGVATLNEVLVAPINADGSVGEWSTTTGLPSARFLPSSIAYNGFLYVIGGTDSNTNFTDVLVVPISSDGAVGTWTTSAALPSGRYGHSTMAHNGFLYAIGGYDDINTLNDVLMAPMNANGAIGAWVSTAALSSGLRHHSSIAHNGFIYVLGGLDRNFVCPSNTQVASIDADAGDANQMSNLLRGTYSHLVDLQSDSPGRSIILNGLTSSGGRIRVQVRVAPEATRVFGTESVVDPAPLGSPIQFLGTGRYVWIRLTLDDTGTSDADQPTFVSDFTVSPISPPTAGVVLDGLDVDIDTQSSTTTIASNWSGFTPGVGNFIAFYEWAIGTAPGLTNVQDWMNVGAATSASNSSLSLNAGLNYVSVRATIAAGLTSPIATSDGVQIISSSSAGGGGRRKGERETTLPCSACVPPGAGFMVHLMGGLAILAPALRLRRWRSRSSPLRSGKGRGTVSPHGLR